MPAFIVRLKTKDKDIAQVFEFDPEDIVQRMRLELPDGSVVVQLVFSYHDDSKRIHTICDRASAEIREVEW